MKINVLGTEGVTKKIELPVCFNTVIRPDLIALIWRIQQKKQSYGAYPLAGRETSITVSHRRHVYKTLYGKGISRVPRKVMSRRGESFNWRGAFMPGTVGGRAAHPPKATKKEIKINKKINKTALKGAIAATGVPEFIEKKYKKKLELPLVIDSAILQKKPKEIAHFLTELLKLKKRKKKVRPGKGKKRGRKYKKISKALIITSSKEDAKKIRSYGFDCAQTNHLNITLLAPGGTPGRLTVWTEHAIEELKTKIK